MTYLYSIAMVSEQTGIAKEVLRKWEDRYGFPMPVRDAAGKRTYTEEHIARLKLIKKLIDKGMRPGQAVPMDEAGLRALATTESGANDDGAECDTGSKIVQWLQLRDPALIRKNLRSELALRGLRHFVGELLPTMNKCVGDAWERGEVAVRDEHLYTEIVQGLVRESLAHAINPAGFPRVLLTTLPGEAHALGILMVETLLSVEGACCVSLGAQSPLEEIVAGAEDFRADIVALSFSAAYPRKKIVPALRELRAQLSGSVQLWAGGAGVLNPESTPRGVAMLPDLNEAVEALRKTRRNAAPHA